MNAKVKSLLMRTLLFAFVLGAGIYYVSGPKPKVVDHPPVAFAVVEKIMKKRCVSCHAQKTSDPMFPVAAAGVLLETPEQIQKWAERSKLRTVTMRTMPFANKTNMTEKERELLGVWVDQGAKVP